MPALPLEPFVYPENLFADSDYQREDLHGAWWVLHTRPRAEKALARRLLARRVSFFLPLYSQRGRRQPASYAPLFPGYLFMRGDHGARLSALETNQVARYLVVVDQNQLTRELVAVHQLMQ